MVEERKYRNRRFRKAQRKNRQQSESLWLQSDLPDEREGLPTSRALRCCGGSDEIATARVSRETSDVRNRSPDQQPG